MINYYYHNHKQLNNCVFATLTYIYSNIKFIIIYSPNDYY